MTSRLATLFSLALSLLALPALPGMAQSIDTPSSQAVDAYAPGTRSGPFVATDRSLSDLAGDGYQIKASFGRALILQKEGSIYSCEVPPAREALSYSPYFVCSQLQEQRPDAAVSNVTDDTKKN